MTITITALGIVIAWLWFEAAAHFVVGLDKVFVKGKAFGFVYLAASIALVALAVRIS